MDPKSLNHLKIITWNACSLQNKILQFRHFLEQNKIHVACIQEASKSKKPLPKIVNYNLISNKKIAIYIKKELHYDQLLETENSISILVNKIRITNFYNYPKFASDLNELKYITKFPNTIILGDFNAKHTNWNNSSTNQNGKILNDFLNCHPQLNLLYPQNSYTHYPTNGNNPSTIDLIVTNLKFYVEPPSTVNDLDSDHLPVATRIHLKVPIKLNTKISRITNWSNYKNYLKNQNPNFPLHSTNSIDKALHRLTNATLHAYHKNTQIINPPSHKLQLPRDILNLINTKNKLRKTSQKYNLFQILKPQINKMSQEINEKIASYTNLQWNHKLSNTKNLLSVHKIIKQLRIPNQKNTPLHTTNGIKFSTQEKSDALADEFSKSSSLTDHLHDNTFHDHIQNTIKNFLQQPQTNPGDPIINFTSLQSLIKSLPNKKSPGKDKITNEMIKKYPNNFILQLVKIYNACYQLNYFPKQFKHSVVIPIAKPNKNPTLPQNYRPISLISMLGKLNEKIINVELTKHTQLLKVIPDSQFGFRKHHSTNMQIARIINKITINTNLNKTTSLTTIDLTKAFDTIWHDALIYKLILLKYPKNLILLIRNYLSNRSFQVKLQNTFSNSQKLTTGVPQGGVLSPQLYNIYTHDIPTDPNTDIALFADDTAIITTSSQTAQANKYTQQHLNKLQMYYQKWKLLPNPEKSTITYFGNRRKSKNHQSTPSLNNLNIPETPDPKYLGVIIDKKLTFKKHISSALCKARITKTKLYPLLGPHSKLNTHLKTQIYKSYILPILTYGSQVTELAAKTTKSKMQIFQNAILRNILKITRQSRIRTKIIHERTRCETISNYIKKLNTNFYKHHILASNLTENILNHPLKNHYRNNQKTLTNIPLN